jgi:molybdopterin-guanine dinucleotide biosynthesis protein A
VSRAGFILAGGESSRMGCHKALLPFAGITLIEHIARQASLAAGSVTVIGKPELYKPLGLTAIPDTWPGAGPLGGIHAALTAGLATWNLILACDMPRLSAPFLLQLIEAAESQSAACLIPAGPGSRPEPLCGVYHSRSLPYIEAAIGQGMRKIMQALEPCGVRIWPVDSLEVFRNCNTPAEWAVIGQNPTCSP